MTLCQSAPGLLPAGTVKGKCLPSGTCDTSAASAGRIWAIYYKSLTWIKAFSLYWRPAPMSKSEPMRTVSRSKKGLPVFGHPTCLNKKCQRNIFTMNGSCCHIRVSMFLSKTSYSNHRPRVFKIDFSQGVLEKVSSSCRHSKASGHF